MKRLLTCLLALTLGAWSPFRMLSPFHKLQLLEDCRELPGVELVCKVAPKGFPTAAFTLVVPYRSGSIKQMKRARKIAKRLLNTPAHRVVRLRIAALPPGVPADRRTAYLGK